MIDQVNAYALTVQNVRTCAEFYRDKLGFKLQELSDDFAYLTTGVKGAIGVALVSAEGLAREIPIERVRPGENLVQRNYFAVFLDDADRAYEELRQKGVRFLQPPATRSNGQRYAFFEDSEGNLWEISHFPKG
ncbi:Glyoxalase/bleomycin resistance protein/dioxygenase domain protein [mine drainage metagenome]|uniref:Glyoxalase/bleomycin resistance protein/dioxygenase domain protein n=1 Tax=mine drainage metagenome TaxID=410659 RepID=T1D5T7_9ZZZZ